MDPIIAEKLIDVAKIAGIVYGGAAVILIPIFFFIHRMLKDLKENYNVVGEKDGYRYYEHKTKRKRTHSTLPTKIDLDWLKYRKDEL